MLRRKLKNLLLKFSYVTYGCFTHIPTKSTYHFQMLFLKNVITRNKYRLTFISKFNYKTTIFLYNLFSLNKQGFKTVLKLITPDWIPVLFDIFTWWINKKLRDELKFTDLLPLLKLNKHILSYLKGYLCNKSVDIIFGNNIL